MNVDSGAPHTRRVHGLPPPHLRRLALTIELVIEVGGQPTGHYRHRLSSMTTGASSSQRRTARTRAPYRMVGSTAAHNGVAVRICRLRHTRRRAAGQVNDCWQVAEAGGNERLRRPGG